MHFQLVEKISALTDNVRLFIDRILSNCFFKLQSTLF